MRVQINQLTIVLDDEEDLYNLLEILYYYKDYCFENPKLQKFQTDKIKFADKLIDVLKHH